MPKGAIVGHLIANFKFRDPETGEIKEGKSIIEPGDPIVVTTVSGQRLTPVYDSFVVVDFFKSDMSEYDANSVFVPLEHLQTLRAMDDRATNILIRLKNYGEADKVVKALAKLFEHEPLQIHTWEEKQGPLLKAIEIEKSILNILLFMIIAVAGFGILAIFSMIVSEKTRDIGILKALGASNGGVMKIFLTYGLLLGVVGAGMGTILGLSITWNINGIENVHRSDHRLASAFSTPMFTISTRSRPTCGRSRSCSSTWARLPLRRCSASCPRCAPPCCTRCRRCGMSR